MDTQTLDRGARPALVGFAVGFAMAFVATILALMSNLFETLLPVLVPASVVLEPLSERMADWNGLVNMVLAGVVNGLIYAAVLWLAVTALAASRRR